MIENSSGLVLRVRPLTETSLIIHWLTPDRGRIATVAKGARRPKSPFHGRLDLFYCAAFSFVRSRSSELHNLREVNLTETNDFLRENLVNLQQTSYAAALIEQTTETETPLTGMYELFADFLSFLKAHPNAPTATPAFELKLLNLLGLRPNLRDSRLLAGTKLLMGNMTDREWGTLQRLKFSSAQEKEINQFLHGFLIYQFGRLPAGRKTT